MKNEEIAPTWGSYIPPAAQFQPPPPVPPEPPKAIEAIIDGIIAAIEPALVETIKRYEGSGNPEIARYHEATKDRLAKHKKAIRDGIDQALGGLKSERDEIRAALAELVGVDGRESLETLRAQISPLSIGHDRDIILQAISVLLKHGA